jgi:hypothetical protein
MLLSRNYNKNVVRNAISRVKALDRKTHLQKVTKKTNDRIVLAITYNPKLPSVPQIVKKTLENSSQRPKNGKNLPNISHGGLQTTSKFNKCFMLSKTALKYTP